MILNMKLLIFIVGLFISLFFIACNKYEGTGGGATIEGKMFEVPVNAVGNPTDTFPLIKDDVYIIYGTENSFYDDKIETSYDGTFRFEHLRKGDYQIFVYEKNVFLAEKKEALIISVSITDKKQTIDLGDIYVKK